MQDACYGYGFVNSLVNGSGIGYGNSVGEGSDNEFIDCNRTAYERGSGTSFFLNMAPGLAVGLLLRIALGIIVAVVLTLV